MEALYQQTQNQIHDLQFTLGRLEGTRNETEAQPFFQAVHSQLGILQSNWEKLDQLASKESVQKKRAAKYKADQVKQEMNGISAAVNHIQVRLTNKWRIAAEREELLTQRIRPTETHLNFENSELLVNDHMQNSHRAIDDMIAQGSSILGSLQTQHMSLKGVKRKILDVGQTLGLSGTTLRMIEKRLEEDWLLFLVGCVFILVFMYCFYRYWKG
uniref:Golgi SNAP receptor complex member 2 n=1 Tax=Panagrolaimus sp. ES5 TaxID=591445 RepID=A0AC34GRD0_9BILA